MSDNPIKSKEFLGVGLSFPIDIDSSGYVAMNSFEDHVYQSILLILQTSKGERVMRPSFGVGLGDLVFEPINSTTMALIKKDVTDALVNFEPRIDVLDVEVTSDTAGGSVIFILLEYRVRRTNTVFNLVYPFYLESGLAS